MTIIQILPDFFFFYLKLSNFLYLCNNTISSGWKSAKKDIKDQNKFIGIYSKAFKSSHDLTKIAIYLKKKKKCTEQI